MIAYLGIGLLGANFVRAFIQRGETVQVWNRTPEKAKALEEYGARAFADPADAVRGAERVHITLSEDAAVDEVLERALPGLTPGIAIVDHTTTSPTLTTARVKRWTERGFVFVHAPVFMGPPNALAATGVMLASGDRVAFDTVAPHLEKMTGLLKYLGEDPSRAAGMKLVGNLFIIELTAAMADSVVLAKSLGIPTDEVAGLYEYFNPGAQVPARLARMLNADKSKPSWTLAMARKDTRLMLEAAKTADRSLAVLPGIAKAMDEWVTKGHQRDDWTIIASDAL